MPKDSNGYTCLERSFFPIIGVMMAMVIVFEFVLVGIYSAEIEDIDSVDGVETHCDMFTVGPLFSGIGLAIGMCFNMLWICGRSSNYELGRVALLFWVASTIVGIAGAGGAALMADFFEDFPQCDKEPYIAIHFFAIVFLVVSLSAPHYFAIKNPVDKIVGKIDRMSREDLTKIKKAIDEKENTVNVNSALIADNSAPIPKKLETGLDF
tara:strand:+ start:143 stop:769 length:627 start_codon:yes stop_codon:yes gene_type:complete